jgi:hypothetical protein
VGAVSQSIGLQMEGGGAVCSVALFRWTATALLVLTALCPVPGHEAAPSIVELGAFRLPAKAGTALKNAPSPMLANLQIPAALRCG